MSLCFMMKNDHFKLELLLWPQVPFKESDAFQKNYKIAIWTWQYFKKKGKAKSMLIAITRQLNVF